MEELQMGKGILEEAVFPALCWGGFLKCSCGFLVDNVRNMRFQNSNSLLKVAVYCFVFCCYFLLMLMQLYVAEG